MVNRLSVIILSLINLSANYISNRNITDHRMLWIHDLALIYYHNILNMDQ